MGAGAGAGSFSSIAPIWSSVCEVTRETISFASAMGSTLAKSLDMTPTISSLKVMETISSSSVTPMASWYSCSEETILASGVEIFTTMPRNSESAVAEEPIIWFITSHAALMLSSSNSKSSVGSSSLPISRPRMICISR